MTLETSEWYNMASMDLEVAKHLENHFYPKPVGIICFHCQQAAEKAVKALIVSYGTEGGMPKLHNLVFLRHVTVLRQRLISNHRMHLLIMQKCFLHSIILSTLFFTAGKCLLTKYSRLCKIGKNF